MTSSWNFLRVRRDHRAVAAVFVTALLVPSPGSAQAGRHSDASAVDRAYADVVMADEFLSVLTGGAQGLPKMDELNQAMIVKALLEGDAETAASRAFDYLTSKAVDAIGGASASAALSAVSLGKSLGMSAHDLFGEGRLQALYAGLSRDTDSSTWPRDYSSARRDDFFGQRFEVGVRPVTLWLKARDEGRMSDAYYETAAYQMLVAMRDFEAACDRYGLQGPDRTPEKLQAALDDELAMAAARARGARAAELSMLEINRALVEAMEAERQAEAARTAAAEAEATEARALAEERARLEREAGEARTRAESLRAALLEGQAESASAPGAHPEPASEASVESLGISLVSREQQGIDMTVFRVRITNMGTQTLRGLVPEVRAARLPLGGGVGWTGGEDLRILAPGASAELSFVGTGDIGAAVLYLSARGHVLASGAFEVAHVTPVEQSPAPEPSRDDGEWLDLPARYEGTALYSWTARMGAQSLTSAFECRMSVTIDAAGVWAETIHPCAASHFRFVWGADPDTPELAAVPVSQEERRHTMSLDAVSGRLDPGHVTSAVENLMRQVDPSVGVDCSARAGPSRVWWKSTFDFRTSAPYHYSLIFEARLDRVR